MSQHDRRGDCSGRQRGLLASLIVAIIGALAPAESLAAATCQPAAEPRLMIDVYKSEVRQAFDTTGTELRRLASTHGEEAHWPALGVYVAGLGYRAAIDDDTQRDASGQFCATVSVVHVVISIQPRVIHLARELGSLPRCLLRAVLDHERQHARADDQALEQWVPDVSHRVRDAIAHLPVLQATTEEDAKAQVAAAIRKELQELIDEIQVNRDRLNQIVDSPDAIVQLRHTC